MNIVVIGRAGRAVAQGRPRGDRAWPPWRDAGGADVVVVAVPGLATSAALGQVTGFAVPGEL
jgi:prephenate dehydrogenase